MSHLKRQAMPKIWPVARKGTTYVIKPLSDLSNSIPLLIVLRDLLKIVRNRKEAKRSIHQKQILLNLKPIKDDKASLYLFDILSLVPEKKSYRIVLQKNGKFGAEEIKESTNSKVAKVVNKKILKGKRIQLNLSDGRNLLSDMKCGVNDSLLVNLKDNKIEKCLPFKENSRVLVIVGKHSGEEGTIKKIKKEEKMVEIESGGNNLNVLIKQLMVIN